MQMAQFKMSSQNDLRKTETSGPEKLRVSKDMTNVKL